MSDIIDGELWDSQRQGRAGIAMKDPEMLTQGLDRHSRAGQEKP